jgi:hypothetical protein
MNQGDGSLVIVHAAGVDIGDADAHGAEADGGDAGAGSAELASFHAVYPQLAESSGREARY